jgi:Fe-S oxidoreductase
LIERARSVPVYAARLGFVPGDPAAILVVEFSGDDRARLVKQVRALRPDVVVAETNAEQAQVWAVRKVGLGLLMSIPGDTKPLPFVEDMAVPVERLADFVRGFERILAEHGASGDFYAHASAGCLHVRPLLNLKTAQGIERMRGISKAVVDLTLSLGGALSGEHGDGLSHAEWIERGYGPELVAAFLQLKRAADPHNLLNPGKIIDPPRMDENLRYGTQYQADAWLPILNFDRQAGLAGAIEMCNGAGVCRKEGGVMCPSFQATREEMHSTRGRANLLRAVISGGLPEGGRAEQAAHQALDLCLECKGCKAECPSGVDVAKLKYEFLHHYYEDHRRPIRDYLFAHIGSLGRAGRAAAPLANLLTQTSLGKWTGENLLGLSARRGMPAFKRANGHGAGPSNQPDLLYLPDAFTEFFHPEVKTAALRVLAAAGLRIAELPLIGAGRTMISKGFLPQAKRQAERLFEAVRALDPEGRLPVIGLEPSEIYTLRDEYLDLLPGKVEVGKLAERAYLFEEFMLRPGHEGRLPVDRINVKMAGKRNGARALLHGHCYQKAQPPAADGYPTGTEASKALLEGLGWQVDVIDSGCCGMAGSFGYEAEHYDLSLQIGEMALFPAVRAADVSEVVVAAGVSCRTQIASGTDREALHPAVLIAEYLD